MKINLIVYLKDGRELSGSYPYIEAHARLDYAMKQPDYLCAEIAGAV